MINLRFHIVSIVAIFLALAIGILAGSTLLDRATVEVLRNAQRSLDEKNVRLRQQNADLREQVVKRQPATDAFGADVLDDLVAGTLSNAPTLILATRGIDESTVRDLQASILAGGGAPLGIVWFDSRLDLQNDDALAKVGTALGLDEVKPEKLRSAVLSRLARGLAATPLEEDGTVQQSPGAGTSDDVVADDPALEVLAQLTDAGLVEWESATDEPASRSLPSGHIDLVLLSGEGAELKAGELMYPLIRALAARTAGIEVGEVRVPRSDLDVIDDPNVPKRGEFVDPLRADDDLVGRLVTVDNVDEPFGRLAAVLALSQLSTSTSGAYGTADSADRPFPPLPK